MPHLVDIHCHLNFPDFNPDREEVIRRTLDAGVWFINIGTDLKTSKESIELAEKYDGIFASVGLHPHYAEKGFDTEKYRELARNPKVVAIGECGLDYNRIKNQDLTPNQNKFGTGQGFKNLQKDVFKKQIELAIETNKPLMIHCRDLHEDVINILKDYKKTEALLRSNVHFFSGTQKQAEQYLKLDFICSFTGVITFTNDYDAIIKELPLEKIMVETDAPFVAPVPYRGKRCEPLYVKETAKRIAEIRGISFGEVSKQTTQNAIDFFGLEHKM